MTCKIEKDERGAVTKISCSRTTPYNCEFCSGYSSALCDFVLPNGKTCDAKMCWSHRTTVGPNLDYCPKHVAEVPHDR